MRTTKKKVFLVAIVLSFIKAVAQLSPLNDPTWKLDTAKSDEFNYSGTQLPLQVDNPGYSPNCTSCWGNNSSNPNANKWHPSGWGENGQAYDWQNNIVIEHPTPGNGELRLILTGTSTNYGPNVPSPIPSQYSDAIDWWYSTAWPNCNWRVAQIYSNPWHLPGPQATTPLKYSYGYFEIRAKLPGYQSSYCYANRLDYPIDSYGNTTGGISPLWWFAGDISSDCTQGNCFKEEVDFMEGMGLQHHTLHDSGDVRPNTINSHWHDWYCDLNNCVTNDLNNNPSIQWNTGDEVDVVNEYHKYGLEWASDRLIFYFDDQPYWINFNASGIPQHPMAMFLGLAMRYPAECAIDGYPKGLIEPTAPLLSYYDPNNTMQFVVDYFRYYKRNISNCQVDYNILTPNDVIAYPSQVRHHINVGIVGNEVITLNSSCSKLLRPSGNFTVKLGVDFEVQPGCDLEIIPTPCN